MKHGSPSSLREHTEPMTRYCTSTTENVLESLPTSIKGITSGSKETIMRETLEEIKEEIMCCERIQKSRGGSDYDKEQAKIHAYNEIRYILFGSKELVEDDDD